MIQIRIDDKTCAVQKEQTVLEAARENGFDVPSLCYHPALKPSGSCRLCVVEVEGKSGRPVTMLSCVLKVREGMVVRTRSEKVDAERLKAFRHLIQMAPQAAKLWSLAAHYGIDLGPPPDGCIRCRLCVRVCREIVGAEALAMEKREGIEYVVPVPERCIGCGTCANICPTDAIRVQDEGTTRVIRIRDEVIGRHPLVRCEGCGRMFATSRFLNHIEKRTAPHPDVKVHHRYCPTCAKLFSERTLSFEGRLQRMPGHH